MVSLLFQLLSEEPIFTKINGGTLYPKLSYCTKMFLTLGQLDAPNPHSCSWSIHAIRAYTFSIY